MTALHHTTPLVRSTALSALHGAPVWLKLESAQPSGSFKLRGMGHAATRALAAGARHLVSSSGGNAGYAVAWAGARLGVPVTVVVPQRTAAGMRDRIAAEGATVVVHGDVWDDAHAHAMALASTLGGQVIHPFDHPDVWAGHATLVDEVAPHMEAPGAVVVSVGGGGLMCGVLEGMHRNGWGEVPLVAVETHGAASLAAALAAGSPVTLPAIDTVALTLGAKRVCARAVDWSRRHAIVPWQCDDRAAVRGAVRLLDDHRILVEPACGAALAAIYDDAAPVAERSVLVVVCGGASITRQQLADFEAAVGA